MKYFLKLTDNQYDPTLIELLKDELMLRVLIVCAQRARKSVSRMNNLDEGEFYISETETNVFGLQNSQSGKLRRTIMKLKCSNFIAEVESKTGKNNCKVYSFNKTEIISWGFETEIEIENKQRTDRERIESEQRQTKNDKNEESKSEEIIINNSKELSVVPTEEKALKVRVDKRNPDIQRGIDLLRELGATITQEKYQRFALNRLFKKNEVEVVLAMMRFMWESHEDQYAPKIYNYTDLEKKWDKIKDYYDSKVEERAFSHGYDPTVDYSQFLPKEQNEVLVGQEVI